MVLIAATMETGNIFQQLKKRHHVKIKIDFFANFYSFFERKQEMLQQSGSFWFEQWRDIYFVCYLNQFEKCRFEKNNFKLCRTVLNFTESLFSMFKYYNFSIFT